jgi:dCTP deaminase
VILTDAQIRQALQDGHLVIDPLPEEDQYSPTALDLHVSDNIRRFKPELYNTRGVNVQIDLDQVEIPNLDPHMEHVPASPDGTIVLRPNQLLIALTVERIQLPPHGKLAARVEGRSRFARLGLVVHMTAPTIHNTFRGPITLEIMNHGPIDLILRPKQTRLCQLIFERIGEEPQKELESFAQDQDSPLGRSPA